jgi:hypothetical protein
MYTRTSERIEIMIGVSSDESGYWIKEELSLMKPSAHPSNKYTGFPEIYVNKSVLSDKTYRNDIEKKIQKVMAPDGEVVICDDHTLLVVKYELLQKLSDMLFIIMVATLFYMLYKLFMSL